MTPKLRGTFGATAAYRNFDFAAVFSYSLGGKFYDLHPRAVDLAGYSDNVPTAAADNGAPRTKTPSTRASATPRNTPRRGSCRSATPFSLASLRIGYAFPKRIASAMRMQALKVSLTCDDLWYSSSVKSPRSLYYPYATSFHPFASRQPSKNANT